jgi:hypothetical protein
MASKAVTRRFWVHGDQVGTHYWCMTCQLFESQEHVLFKHPWSRMGLLRVLASHYRYDEPEGRWTRPRSAPNCRLGKYAHEHEQ